jgi:gluconolactonase
MSSFCLARLFEIGKEVANNLIPWGRSSFLRANTSHFTALFPKKVRLVRVATGFRFTEGPVWYSKEKCLLFSDIPASTIFKLSADGHVSVFRKPSGHSNGLTIDGVGRLVACEHGNRRVTRTEPSGVVMVLADTFEGKKLNAPNDVVVKKDGTIYFTDPFYKKVGGVKPHQQEVPIQGVYKLPPHSTEISVVVSDFEKPNGLAFSPDEKTLYIDDSSSRCHIRAFDVLSNGNLANGRLFHDMNSQEKGNPDGMKVDRKGNLYCTGPGGVWVLNPQGQHLGTIVTPEKPANCAWGDSDFRTLYITAKTSVYAIRVNIPGINCFLGQQ